MFLQSHTHLGKLNRCPGSTGPLPLSSAIRLFHPCLNPRIPRLRFTEPNSSQVRRLYPPGILPKTARVRYKVYTAFRSIAASRTLITEHSYST